MARSCLLVDLSSGTVAEMAQMTHGRYNHAVATIGKHVFAVAGYNGRDAVRTCERYDISADEWTQLPANSAFDEFLVGVSVVTTNHRYIHALAGRNT